MTLTLVIGNKNYSSWSLRPWLFMQASGVAFDEIRIPLDVPGYREAIRQYSPTGRVPVLLDGAATVWESLAICEYVAGREGLPGWPAAREARATAFALAHEMHAGFPALRGEFPMNCRARRRGVEPSATAAGDIRRIGEIWSGERPRQPAGDCFLFGAFGIVDAMFAPIALRWQTYGFELPARAADYARALLAHPSLQAWCRDAAAETESIAAGEIGEPA